MNWIDGNRITLIHRGESFFDLLIQLIESSKVEIIIETYIFEGNAVGKRIGEALKAARTRGVKVFLIVDGVGSMNTPNDFFEDLRAAGIDLIVFRTFRRWPLLGGLALRRLHRKSFVFDSTKAIVGGINIADDQVDSETAPGKLDLAVFIEGPLVSKIRYHSLRFFYRVGNRWLEWIRFIQAAKRKSDFENKGETPALYLIRDNFGFRRKLQHFYLAEIERAENEILIASAYFVPHRRLRSALRRAVEHGVKVRVLIQGRSDSPIAYYASKPFLSRLVRHGVEIIEIQNRVLHAKSAVIDDHWATVGSFNWEPFSLFLNLEGNVFFESAVLSSELRTKMNEWINQYGKSLTSEDLKLSFGEWIKTQFALFMYQLTRWIAGYPFD